MSAPASSNSRRRSRLRSRPNLAPRRRLFAEWLEPRTLLAGIEVHAPIVEVNGIAYFPGRTDSGDFHLWRSNGTAAGTYLLKNVALASNFSNPGYLANVNGTLFFRGDDGTNGPELWK